MLLALDLQHAADSLQQIAETTSGERQRRAAVVALVLRSLEQTAEQGAGAAFLRRRAERDAEEIASGAERALLKRLLLLGDSLAHGDAEVWLASSLTHYAYELETTRRLPEAEAVLALAASIAPESAEIALHAARVVRRQGKRERALELYRAARDLDTGDGSIARLAAIGEAVVSADPERGLGRVIRASLGARDAEAAAVGLEERARVRRARGARFAAMRDLCLAAARFADPVDRARVAHQLADLFIAGNDPAAAREALLFALEVGDAAQRDHARARLHTVSRDLGDRVGMRRWRSFSPPAMVSLSSRPGAPPAHSAARWLSRWRERYAAAE